MINLNIEEMMGEPESLADIPPSEEAEVEKDEQVEEPAESPTENETEESPSQEGEEVEEEEVEEQPEETETEDTPDDNKEVPFHKNPRWQKMREDNKALEAKVAELNLMTETVSELKETVQSMNQGTKTVPPEYKAAFGDNVDAYNNWNDLQQNERTKMKAEIMQDIASKQEADTKAVQEQQEAIQKNVEYIEDAFDVKLPEKSSIRNEYMNFMLEFKPTNNSGNLDFTKGWEYFSANRKTKAPSKTKQARKKVVEKTGVDTKAETPESDVYELGDLMPRHLKQ